MKHGSSAWFATDALHALHLLLGTVGICLLVILLFVLAKGVSPTAETVRFEQARVCVERPVVTSFRRSGLARLLERPPTMSTGCWRQVELPYINNIGPVALEVDEQPISRAWFDVRYVVPRSWDSSEPLMIYVPRVGGWGWQVRVDGQSIGDNLDNWRMTWNTPVMARLLPGNFKPDQVLEIRIAVAFLPEAGYSASRVTVGPASAVGKRLAIRQFLQISMPQACSLVLLLMTGFFFAFWLSRRNETAHLLLAAAAIVWCICNLQYVLPRHDDPLIEGMYSSIVNMSVSWFMWLIYLFVFNFDARRVHWLEWVLPLYVLIMCLFDIPMSGLIFDASVLIALINAFVAACVASLIVRRAIWGGTIELRVIAIALILAILAGLHDVGLLAQAIHPESIYVLPYGGLLLFGSFLFAVQRRYVRAIEDHEVLAESLALQLAEQKAELNANHLRLRELERKETLAAERQRLMHDMHDGVGSTLLTALAASEQSDLSRSELSGILRTCVDDLRLVIDSLDPVEHDLVTLLATIRYRLGPQLDAAGLLLEWDIKDLPELKWLESSDALHVLRIIQEALANVVKHANASRVSVKTLSGREYVEISISDNGCGFEMPSTTFGRGLRSLKRRSEQLGGSLRMLSGEGRGTTLTLKLPIIRS